MIKKLILVFLCLSACCRAYSRVNEWAHFETYCQFAPAAFMLGAGLMGVSHENGFTDRLVNTTMTYLYQTALTYPFKWTIREKRPDGTAYNSFPSGHTAATFAGAEMVRMEYGWGWGAVFYANAVVVGTMRVVHRRHWWWDVASGAALGVVSAHLGRITTDNLKVFISPSSVSLTYSF